MNLEEIRTHYPGLQKGIQLNTGGVGLPSNEVREAIDAGFNSLYEEYVPPIEWHTLMCQSAEVARKKLAAFFGAKDDEIALTISTADGYAAAIAGLSWEPGDEVLITSEEHPMPHRAVLALEQREGVVLKVVEIDHDPAVIAAAHRGGPDAAYQNDLHEPRHHRHRSRGAGRRRSASWRGSAGS